MLGLLRLVRRFAWARRGAAAVEFAIIAPVALMIYAGASEVVDGVIVSRKVSNVARTAVDLLSAQGTSGQATSSPTPANATQAAQLTNIMAGAQMLLSPEPLDSLKITLTAVDLVNDSSTGKCCKATVRWSYTQNGTLRPCNPAMTGTTATTPGISQLPAEMLPTGTTLPNPIAYLVSDVEYTYQPVMSLRLLAFQPKLSRTVYMMPRTTGQVVSGTLPSSGTRYGTVCY